MSNSKPDTSPSQPASQPPVASERHWEAMLREVIDRQRKAGETDFAVCGRLAPQLSKIAKTSWTPNYIHQVLHRSKHLQPSPRLIWAIEKLHARKPRVRNDGFRLYTAFQSNEERAFVQRLLSAEERRTILMDAAAHQQQIDKDVE